MSELVVVAFKQDIERAAVVLGQIRARDEAWSANLHGAVAAYRNDRGELTIDRSYQSSKGEGAIVGGLLGSFVGIVLAALALPVTAGVGTVAAATTFVAGAVGGSIIGAKHGAVDDSWWKNELGVSDEFVDNIRATVAAGDSAIFILLREPDPDDLDARFRSYGGVVLRSKLTPEQVAKLHFRINQAANRT